MKRVVFLLLACGAILLVTSISFFIASPFAHAGGSSLQMLSGTFKDTNLSVDGVTKITLLSIPFSVSAPTSKLDVTNFMDVNQNGAYGYTICELDIDNAAFFSVTTNIPPNSSNVPVGLTNVASAITSGNHTFAIKCLGFAQYQQGEYSVHSRGTSIIIR